MSGGQDPVLVPALADGVLTLRLNRPESLNPLSKELRAAMVAELEQATSDPEVRCVLILSSGKHFSAGGDLKLAQQRPAAVQIWDRFHEVHDYTRRLIEFEKPLLCAVQGTAAGGGLAMALSCDIILAGESARLLPAFARVGILPDTGILYTLPRRVGAAQAKEIIWTGEAVPAPRALGLGMVDRVVPDAELESTALDLARRIARGPTLVLSLTKRLIDGALAGDLRSLLDGERLAQALATQSEDYHEGVDAFFEKRPPRFRGR